MALWYLVWYYDTFSSEVENSYIYSVEWYSTLGTEKVKGLSQVSKSGSLALLGLKPWVSNQLILF